jgi:hypothetical protein
MSENKIKALPKKARLFDIKGFYIASFCDKIYLEYVYRERSFELCELF